jgi:hypothetical protein
MHDFVVRQRAAFGANQQCEQIEFLAGQRHQLAADSHLALQRIHFDRTKPGGQHAGSLPGTDPLQQAPHPGRQFLQQERLVDAVVGTAVQDLARGQRAAWPHQCDDRDTAQAAHAPYQLGPVHIAQLGGQDGEVRGRAPQQIKRLAAGLRGNHGVGRRTKMPPQQATDARVCIGNQ